MIVGNSLLTARGIPASGEGDLKTCVAMLMMDRLGAGGSYTEFYAMDFDEDFVLMGHDGPGHIAIGDGKPVLRALGLYHGKRGDGISVEFNVSLGPITILGMTQTADGRLKLLAAEGESIPGPTLEIGNTNSRLRFALDPAPFMDAWCDEGPTHHVALASGISWAGSTRPRGSWASSSRSSRDGLMRIALLVTCLADTLLPAAARATVRVLERARAPGRLPAAQTCCGQMHANTGYRDEAAALARRTVRGLRRIRGDRAALGSCAGHVRHQYAQLAGEHRRCATWPRARPTSPRGSTSSASCLVDVLGVTTSAPGPRPGRLPPDVPLAAGPARGGPAAAAAPRRAGTGAACPSRRPPSAAASAGRSRCSNADVSTAMLMDKVDRRERVPLRRPHRARLLVPHAHRGRLRRARAGVRTMHLAEILAGGAT